MDMYDMEKKLKYLDLMSRRKVPEEYRHDGAPKKYKTECERYTEIYKEIENCDEQELKNLEILVENQRDSGNRLSDYKNVLPLAVSIFTMIFMISVQVITAVMQNSNLAVVLESAIQNINNIYYIILFVSIIILAMYALIDKVSARIVKRKRYLLYIIADVKKKKGMV